MENNCPYTTGNGMIGLSLDEYGSLIKCPNQECPTRGRFYKCYSSTMHSLNSEDSEPNENSPLVAAVEEI